MKIIDAFTFYNELDMLYYRLSVLYDIVDYFIIVEATLTHVGNPKKLYYDENKEIFSKFSDKIIHIIDDKLIPNVYDAKINENHQRNYIYEGIKILQLNSDDKIIISDVDEIPDINALKYIKETNQIFNIRYLSQDFYYYNLTCKNPSHKWNFPRIVSYDALINKFNKEPEICRTGHGIQLDGGIVPGGWHLSYFGDPSFIKNKIEQFMHQEVNLPQFKNEEYIKQQIENCSDLFSRDEGWVRVPISENSYLPPEYDKYLQKYLG